MKCGFISPEISRKPTRSLPPKMLLRFSSQTISLLFAGSCKSFSLMYSHIFLMALVRGISETPKNFCMAGEMGRGWVMPPPLRMPLSFCVSEHLTTRVWERRFWLPSLAFRGQANVGDTRKENAMRAIRAKNTSYLLEETNEKYEEIQGVLLSTHLLESEGGNILGSWNGI